MRVRPETLRPRPVLQRRPTQPVQQADGGDQGDVPGVATEHLEAQAAEIESEMSDRVGAIVNGQ